MPNFFLHSSVIGNWQVKMLCLYRKLKALSASRAGRSPLRPSSRSRCDLFITHLGRRQWEMTKNPQFRLVPIVMRRAENSSS
jgi:hypothetical protein